MTADALPRVLFVSSHAGHGGSERFLELLLGGLSASVTARVVSLQDGPLVGALAAANPSVPVAVVPTGTRAGLVTGAWRLRRHLDRRGCDVIHANGVKAALVCAIARVIRPRRTAPVVWMKHDHSRDGWVARWVARRCVRVVGVSASVLSAVEGCATTQVVPPGVPTPAAGEADVQTGRRALRAVCGDADGPIVAMTGRLDPAKGHLQVVDALVQLRRALPEVALAVIGGADPSHPGYERVLRAHALAVGLDGGVHLLGHRDDALRLMAGADVLAIASHSVDRRGRGREGFGLVAVEAMALGTPVVAFADGAVPEVLGECGVLVPPRDVDALARGLHDVLTDAALAQRLRRCGRQRAARFDPTVTARAMAGVYREAAAPNR